MDQKEAYLNGKIAITMARRSGGLKFHPERDPG